MLIPQIGKSLIQSIDDIIGIQIPIRLLRTDDQINRRIRRPFQFRVRALQQRIGHCLQPFCHIAVLKDLTAKLSRFESCGNPKIPDTMTGRSAFHTII